MWLWSQIDAHASDAKWDFSPAMEAVLDALIRRSAIQCFFYANTTRRKRIAVTDARVIAPPNREERRQQQQYAAVYGHASHHEELIRVYAIFPKSYCADLRFNPDTCIRADLRFNPDTCIRNVKSKVLRIIE